MEYQIGNMKYFLYSIIFICISCTHGNDTIRIKGSDTEVNLVVQLSEVFHTNNPTVFVSISGGGSGLGIASLLNGTTDIANSSRSINKSEIELFNEKQIALDSFAFAQDAIAFVASEALDVDSISTNDLADILSGKVTNWSSLTGDDLPINIYGRQSNSGTHEFVKSKLKIEFSPYAKQMNGNAQILEAIRADDSGIGYVGAGYVIHGGSKGLKILSIYNGGNPAISPLDKEKIKAGVYYFQRPLFQYYKSSSYKNIKPFLDFEKTDIGKSIIQSSGYYPIL